MEMSQVTLDRVKKDGGVAKWAALWETKGNPSAGKPKAFPIQQGEAIEIPKPKPKAFPIQYRGGWRQRGREQGGGTAQWMSCLSSSHMHGAEEVEAANEPEKVVLTDVVHDMEAEELGAAVD